LGFFVSDCLTPCFRRGEKFKVPYPSTSSIAEAYAYLQTLDPNWFVVMGKPTGPGWLHGADLLQPDQEPFCRLLNALGTPWQTADRRTLVATFALRYGWSAGAAIAPFLLCRLVPNVSLDNISIKFACQNHLFERVALHRAEGTILSSGCDKNPGMLHKASSLHQLRQSLRHLLVQQATPVVEALHHWSRFSTKALWGMITSSWGSQFVHIMQQIDAQDAGWTEAERFFDGHDLVALMRPRFYQVIHHQRRRIFHRRSACCRYYLVPHGGYCASCPLIPEAESMARNKQWMETE
jgi:ferric iron reductase protein FhuF